MIIETLKKNNIFSSLKNDELQKIAKFFEKLNFKTTAKFVLAIETSGTFQRLNYHKFWKKYSISL